MGRWDIRAVYLYLVAFVTLILIIVGVVQAIRAAVDLALSAPSKFQFASIDTPLPYRDGQPDTVDAAVLEAERQFQAKRQAEFERRAAVGRLVGGLSLLAVAFPVHRAHRRRIGSGEAPA